MSVKTDLLPLVDDEKSVSDLDLRHPRVMVTHKEPEKARKRLICRLATATIALLVVSACLVTMAIVLHHGNERETIEFDSERGYARKDHLMPNHGARDDSSSSYSSESVYDYYDDWYSTEDYSTEDYSAEADYNSAEWQEYQDWLKSFKDNFHYGDDDYDDYGDDDDEFWAMYDYVTEPLGEYEAYFDIDGNIHYPMQRRPAFGPLATDDDYNWWSRFDDYDVMDNTDDYDVIDNTDDYYEDSSEASDEYFNW